MKNAHFHVFLVILIVGFGVLGYTSYRTIEFSFSPKVVSAGDVASVEVTQVDVAPPAVVTVPVSNESSQQPTTTTATTAQTPTTATTTTPAQPAVAEQAVTSAKELTGERKILVDALTRLIKDDIRMKIGSQGTRVGTVQKFLNIYENKKSPVDNKYGEGTKKSITALQQALGDEVDGLADPGTYQKMIDWLKSSN